METLQIGDEKYFISGMPLSLILSPISLLFGLRAVKVAAAEFHWQFGSVFSLELPSSPWNDSNLIGGTVVPLFKASIAVRLWWD